MVKNNKQQESIVNTRQTPTANPSVDPVTVSGFNHYANGIRMKKIHCQIRKQAWL
jgi:hypothetical protein